MSLQAQVQILSSSLTLVAWLLTVQYLASHTQISSALAVSQNILTMAVLWALSVSFSTVNADSWFLRFSKWVHDSRNGTAERKLTCGPNFKCLACSLPEITSGYMVMAYNPDSRYWPLSTPSGHLRHCIKPFVPPHGHFCCWFDPSAPLVAISKMHPDSRFWRYSWIFGISLGTWRLHFRDLLLLSLTFIAEQKRKSKRCILVIFFKSTIQQTCPQATRRRVRVEDHLIKISVSF